MDCKRAQQDIMPYIERRLSDRETEDFIEHIRGCEACSEELEVYFTIYYALEQLDREDQGSYDISHLLENDLKQAEKRVQNHHVLRFYRWLFLLVVGSFAAVFIFTGVQMAVTGSFEKTTLFQLFGKETESTEQPQTQKPHSIPQTTEAPQQETNRKRQVIVTTPETEAWKKGNVAGDMLTAS